MQTRDLPFHILVVFAWQQGGEVCIGIRVLRLAGLVAGFRWRIFCKSRDKPWNVCVWVVMIGCVVVHPFSGVCMCVGDGDGGSGVCVSA